MTRRSLLLRAGLIAVAVVIADQISKAIVVGEIDRGTAVDVVGPLRFTLSHNDGVAFGLAGGGGVFVILLSMVALVALGAFVASAPNRPGIWVAGGLIFGGAMGNLIDRVRFGHVVDFILLPHWPAFNLADCAITVGVILLAWNLIRVDPSRGDGGRAAPESVESERVESGADERADQEGATERAEAT